MYESNQALRRACALCFTFLLALSFALPLAAPALADEDRAALFEQARAALLTPAEVGIQSGEYTLRTGDSAYVPSLNAPIIPYDELETAAAPAQNGTFESADTSIVTVDEAGLMTGASAGSTVVTHHAQEGDRTYLVTVSDDAMPEGIKNYIYVLNREFTEVKRARLPKYNKYAKWYYGRKNEVGWCSVFTIYCANASGNNPVKKKSLELVPPQTVQFLREGQVGNQFDGFMQMERFGGVPKAGYLVIYADMNNSYRTVHIASVVSVRDMGEGIYAVTTVEGNMSNSVKSYCYLYDSNKDNHMVGTQDGLKLQNNMAALPAQEQTDPLVQYDLHTDHWSVFGFCQTW
ncbi:MAG: Ig-like domain-containing protein [Clostridia bacterium]